MALRAIPPRFVRSWNGTRARLEKEDCIMTIGLFGEDSSLILALQNDLKEKGFGLWRPTRDLPRDQSQHLVFRKRRLPTDWESLREAGMVLVCVGEPVDPAVSFDLVLAPGQSEGEALAKLSRLVRRKLAGPPRPSWDEYFMRIAEVASMRSNCIKRKVGAVVVKDRRIVSTGYNGTPRGTRNCNEGGCPRCSGLAASGTRLDECLCSHAEENAITQAAYHGTSVKDGCLYSTFSPCLMCAKMIINSGISEVVFNLGYPLNDSTFRLFDEAGVTIRNHRIA